MGEMYGSLCHVSFVDHFHFVMLLVEIRAGAFIEQYTCTMPIPLLCILSLTEKNGVMIELTHLSRIIIMFRDKLSTSIAYLIVIFRSLPRLLVNNLE